MSIEKYFFCSKLYFSTSKQIFDFLIMLHHLPLFILFSNLSSVLK